MFALSKIIFPWYYSNNNNDSILARLRALIIIYYQLDFLIRFLCKKKKKKNWDRPRTRTLFLYHFYVDPCLIEHVDLFFRKSDSNSSFVNININDSNCDEIVKQLTLKTCWTRRASMRILPSCDPSANFFFLFFTYCSFQRVRWLLSLMERFKIAAEICNGAWRHVASSSGDVLQNSSPFPSFSFYCLSFVSVYYDKFYRKVRGSYLRRIAWITYC